MANLPITTYKGTSSYLSTISNKNGNLLFDTDKKEIFLDDGTNRESYGGGAGDKTYATLAQAKADIANISEKDTVFVKEGTSGSLTQRVDELEDEVEQINTDLSVLPKMKYISAGNVTSNDLKTAKMFIGRYCMPGTQQMSGTLFPGTNNFAADWAGTHQLLQVTWNSTNGTITGSGNFSSYVSIGIMQGIFVY
jgi:hypothetical protein